MLHVGGSGRLFAWLEYSNGNRHDSFGWHAPLTQLTIGRLQKRGTYPQSILYVCCAYITHRYEHSLGRPVLANIGKGNLDSS